MPERVWAELTAVTQRNVFLEMKKRKRKCLKRKQDWQNMQTFPTKVCERNWVWEAKTLLICETVKTLKNTILHCVNLRVQSYRLSVCCWLKLELCRRGWLSSVTDFAVKAMLKRSCVIADTLRCDAMTITVTVGAIRGDVIRSGCKYCYRKTKNTLINSEANKQNNTKKRSWNFAKT